MASSAGVRDKNILGPGAKSLGRGPDLSQLKSPILTSLSGTRQVIHALECGTGKVVVGIPWIVLELTVNFLIFLRIYCRLELQWHQGNTLL